MKKNILRSFLLSLAITASVPALAQQVNFEDRIDKPYVSLNLGLNTVDDTIFNFATGVDVGNKYDNGFVINGELGYNFGQYSFIDNVKLGVELGYSINDIDSHTIGGAAQAGPTGDLRGTSILANMYHEFNTNSAFVPYYGLGIGAIMVDADEFGIGAVPNALTDDGTAFLYQVTAGVNYMLTSDIDIGVRYRYLATEGLELAGNGAGAMDKDFELESHNFTVGLTYRF